MLENTSPASGNSWTIAYGGLVGISPSAHIPDRNSRRNKHCIPIRSNTPAEQVVGEIVHHLGFLTSSLLVAESGILNTLESVNRNDEDNGATNRYVMNARCIPI